MGCICLTGETVQINTLVRDIQKNVDKLVQTDSIDATTQLVHHLSINKAQTEKSALALMISLIKSYKNTVVLPFWEMWKEVLLITVTQVPEVNENEYLQEAVRIDVRVNEKHVLEANEKISFDCKTALRDSPLFVFGEQVRKMGESPMPLTSLFRFFEEMMDKKYELDVSDLSEGKAYLPISEFYLDYLLRVYGLKKLAQKSMWQMLLTLKQLNDQSHAYGRLICSLLHVYDPYPIPPKLSLFLTRARIEMNKLINSTKAKNKKLEEIQLIDAVELTYTLIPNDKYLRSKAISMLKPKNMTEEEFLMFRLNYKMNKLDLTPESMYNEIDLTNEKRISLARLVEYIRKSWEIYVQEVDINVLSQIFNLKSTSKIPKYLFMSKITVKPLTDYSQNEKLMIPKSTFLSTLVNCFKSLQTRDTAYLTALFQSLNAPKISQAEFYSMLNTLDPTIPEADLQKHYEEALLLNSDFSLDGILQDSFIKIVLLHSIGQVGLRDFGISYLAVKFEQVKADFKSKKFVKKSVEAFPERKERPRRPSLMGETSPKISRGSTPVEDMRQRTKSPVFGHH